MITKTKAVEIGQEVREAVEAIAARHGMTVDFRGGVYTGSTYSPRKITFKVKGADRVEFERDCFLVRDERGNGLLPEDFGKTITSQGELFKIVGLNLRASRFPVVAERVSDNKRFKMTVVAVNRALGR